MADNVGGMQKAGFTRQRCCNEPRPSLRQPRDKRRYRRAPSIVARKENLAAVEVRRNKIEQTFRVSSIRRRVRKQTVDDRHVESVVPTEVLVAHCGDDLLRVVYLEVRIRWPEATYADQKFVVAWR